MLASNFGSGKVEAGCDEAGRGCLAGPVFAAAVILPDDFSNDLLNDSKKLREKVRMDLDYQSMTSTLNGVQNSRNLECEEFKGEAMKSYASIGGDWFAPFQSGSLGPVPVASPGAFKQR